MSEELSQNTANTEPCTNKGKLKLNIGRTILVGLAFFSICIFWETYDNLMPLFLRNFDNLSKTTIGVIMALDNLLALFLLPFMGLFSDNFKSKYGRRIPFILVGAVLAALALLLLNFAHNAHMLWLVMLVTVFLLVFMCLYRTPAVSLMPDVTPKPIRSKANAVINIMGLVGGVVFLVLSNPALKLVSYYTKTVNGEEVKFVNTGNWLLMSIVAALMIAAAVVMLFTVRENELVAKREKLEREHGIEEEKVEEEKPKHKNVFAGLVSSIKGLERAERRSYLFLMGSVFLWFFGYNAAKTWMSNFAADALGGNFSTPLLIANVVGFLCYIPSSIISTKIGRRNTVLCGLGLVAIGFLLALVFIFAGIKGGTLVALFYVVFGFVGAGWATLNVHSYVMSVEFAKKGNTGFFTGNYYAFSMSAQMLTPIAAGALYEAIGYNAIFPYCFIFIVLSMCTMLFVKHGNAKVIDNRSTLEKLDIDD